MMNFIRKHKFLFGFIYGVVMCCCVMIILEYFNIHPFSSSKISATIYSREKNIEYLINKYYQGEYTSDKLVDGALKGMVSSLGDKYSTYFNPEEFAELTQSLEGNYVGIGVTIREDENKCVYIEKIKSGGPADEAGFKVGDKIISIDGEDVDKKGSEIITSKLKSVSNQGNNYKIGVQRDGNTIVLDVKTDKVELETVKHKTIDGVGYIIVSGFDNTTDDKFIEAVDSLEKENIKSLVFDLRDNGGGVLESAVNMLNRLLPEGKLITEKSKKSGDREYNSDSKQQYTGKMIVLVNGNTASASEIFTGTLKARERATIIGTKTYGKGIVQTILALNGKDAGGIRLTTSEYYLPDGKSIHLKGIEPDVNLEYTGKKGDEYDESKDNQLQKALEMAKE